MKSQGQLEGLGIQQPHLGLLFRGRGKTVRREGLAGINHEPVAFYRKHRGSLTHERGAGGVWVGDLHVG